MTSKREETRKVVTLLLVIQLKIQNTKLKLYSTLLNRSCKITTIYKPKNKSAGLKNWCTYSCYAGVYIVCCSHNTKYIFLILQRRFLNADPLQPIKFPPAPPPPKEKRAPTKTSKQENEDILNVILPPRYGSFLYIAEHVQTTHELI